MPSPHAAASPRVQPPSLSLPASTVSTAAGVVATDLNARALWMTRLNAALNEVDVDVRDGSFFEPVAG